MMKALNEESYGWYMAFTAPYTEQRVKKQLDEAGIANFLPLRTSRLLWCNKATERSVPAIPRTVFIRLSPENRETLLGISSLFLLADLSSFGLTEQQMEGIRVLFRKETLPVDTLSVFELLGVKLPVVTD